MENHSSTFRRPCLVQGPCFGILRLDLLDLPAMRRVSKCSCCPTNSSLRQVQLPMQLLHAASQLRLLLLDRRPKLEHESFRCSSSPFFLHIAIAAASASQAALDTTVRTGVASSLFWLSPVAAEGDGPRGCEVCDDGDDFDASQG